MDVSTAKVIYLPAYSASNGRRGRKSLEGSSIHPKADLDLTWPSGAGSEIGFFDGDLEDIWSAVTRKLSSGDQNVQMFQVTEDGAEAIILVGLLKSPISFYTEPGAPKHRLAIIADSREPTPEIIQSLASLLPSQTTHFYVSD